MKISGIDFPNSLLNALRNDHLVVFAGAGVSIPQPAGLPTFRQLAEAVATGTGEGLQEGESEDRFLGRLHDKGQQVHLQAAQELQKNAPKPTEIHSGLLALYRTLDSLRVVTTNFDTLFEEAAKHRFGAPPEVFWAPALPLGRDFNGIVHIHGSIDNPPNMVLTDTDFGRAYLIEGWARRFLVDLFQTFPVLFVGYGHNDTIINYLVRALPVDRRPNRFVLTDESSGNRWQTLGIEPVFFAKVDSDDYAALYEGVAGLSKDARRGILDRQRDLTEIAKNSPSIDKEAMDRVEESLSDPAHTRFFTEAASHIDWVRWLDERGHLESLFGVDPNLALGDAERLLGRWLAGTFVKDHPDEMFRLIAKHRMRMHHEFWDTLGHAIASQNDTPWEPDTLERWVSLLLATAPPQPKSYVLLRLGERCVESDLMDSLLDVFRMMSDPKLSIKERLAIFETAPGPSTTAEVIQIHKQYELDQLWKTGLKPNLDDVAEPLLDQLVDNFTTRHRTLCAWQAAGKEWDPDSYWRSAIEPHEQDAHPESVDVLIDAARDSLEHLITAKPEIAANWCDQRIRSDVPVLRRLAVHALYLRGDLTPNAKIDWMLDKIVIHDQMAHHELFRIIRAIYPSATPEQRQSLIEEVHKFILPGEEGEDTAGTIAYQKFTWFSWLSDSDPDCSLVKQHVEEILEGYPEFKPRKWADLTHYRTMGSIGHRSPWSADELLSSPAKEWTYKLLAFRGTDEFGEEAEDRVGLVRAVEEAATQDFEWGLELADDLTQSERWESDLWGPLMNSWARQQGANEQGKVLNRLLWRELHKSHTKTIAKTLVALVNGGDMSYASGLLSKANQVATTLWDNLDENEPVMSIEGWYGKAINHTAGILTKFWLCSISSWYNELDPHPATISEEYSEFLEKIVEDHNTAGRLGRSAIARELAFIMDVDQQWAIEHLLPSFESENQEDRQASWEGLLYGRISPPVADALEGAFFDALSDIDELFGPEGKSRKLFIRSYTELVAYFVDDPLSSWIPTFFESASVEDRRKLAWNLTDILRHMETERQKELWDRWLQKYWENRLLGTPAKLDPSEAGAMLHWVPELHSQVPAAVDLAIQMQNPQLEYCSIVSDLNRGEMGERYPQATAKLLIYLANCNLPRWGWHQGKELIEKLIQSGLPEDLKDKLKDIPVKLGL